mmetsp:Transcript_42803/g.118244  ORF Transcript_42803/g.118244 Transcript_42803/m.118244 type:complete len:216 (+) Transcript_42803:413-1060(+)
MSASYIRSVHPTDRIGRWRLLTNEDAAEDRRARVEVLRFRGSVQIPAHNHWRVDRCHVEGAVLPRSEVPSGLFGEKLRVTVAMLRHGLRETPLRIRKRRLVPILLRVCVIPWVDAGVEHRREGRSHHHSPHASDFLTGLQTAERALHCRRHQVTHWVLRRKVERRSGVKDSDATLHSGIEGLRPHAIHASDDAQLLLAMPLLHFPEGCQFACVVQ